jgi:hypothetical protein
VFDGDQGDALVGHIRQAARLQEAAMRLVVRFLLVEFALAWAIVLAGSVRVAVQIWPFLVGALPAGLRGRAWRRGLGLLVGVPIAVGWPLLFWPAQAVHPHQDWLKLAALWWVLLGAAAFLPVLVRVIEAGSRSGARVTGCRCGTCVTRDL